MRLELSTIHCKKKHDIFPIILRVAGSMSHQLAVQCPQRVEDVKFGIMKRQLVSAINDSAWSMPDAYTSRQL